MLQQLLNKIHRVNRAKLPEETIELSQQIYNIPDMQLADLFKLELEKVGGKAFLCKDREDLISKIRQLFAEKQWKTPVTFSPEIKQILNEATLPYFDTWDKFPDLDVGLNTCEALAAWTGSVLVSAAQPGGRQINVYSPELIIIARYDQLFRDIQDALEYVMQKYDYLPSQLSFITGPSKTADIEKTLIYGMHGAREVFVFLW